MSMREKILRHNLSKKDSDSKESEIAHKYSRP